MKRIFAVLVTAALLLAVCAQVSAAEVDPEQKGSVSVTLKYMGTPISGGSLTLYHVGNLVWMEDHYEFALTEAFAASGVALDALNSQVAAELADYADLNGVESLTQQIDETGHLCFEGLELGLYVMVQKEAADGFCGLQPFLVTVPVSENGAYVYDVDATPKLSLVPENTDPTEPPTTVPPTEPDPSLPQTGQTNWPVPLLAIGGIFTFFFGLILNRSGRRKNYEG